MNLSNQIENISANYLKPKLKILSAEINGTEMPLTKQPIRFEERKEQYIWAHPDEICFVKSADHYVKSLVKCGREKKWMSRHCTLKELLDILPSEDFIRLNKFYIVNLNHFSHINESEKILYFSDDSSIPVPHRISPYLRHLLKTTHT
jgi:DNA-binding LytR/AlgR family response regulator